MTDRDVLAAFREIVEDRGYPPSYAELADRFGVSAMTIKRDMDALVEAGKIRRTPGVARGITIVDGKDDTNEPVA